MSIKKRNSVTGTPEFNIEDAISEVLTAQEEARKKDWEKVRNICREEIRAQQKSGQCLKTFSKCALGALAVAGAVTAFELGYRCYTKGNAVEYDDVVKNRIGPRSPILAWLLVDVLFWRVFMRSQARKIPDAEWHYIKSKICGLLAGADPDLSKARKQGWQK